MTMTHKRCGAFVLWETLFDTDSFIELSCFGCGKRWFLHRSTPLARLITDGT